MRGGLVDAAQLCGRRALCGGRRAVDAGLSVLGGGTTDAGRPHGCQTAAWHIGLETVPMYGGRCSVAAVAGARRGSAGDMAKRHSGRATARVRCDAVDTGRWAGRCRTARRLMLAGATDAQRRRGASWRRAHSRVVVGPMQRGGAADSRCPRNRCGSRCGRLALDRGAADEGRRHTRCPPVARPNRLSPRALCGSAA